MHLLHLVVSRLRLVWSITVIHLNMILELLLENVTALKVVSLWRYRSPLLRFVRLHIRSCWKEEAVLSDFVLFVLESSNGRQRAFLAAMVGGVAVLGFLIVSHEDRILRVQDLNPPGLLATMASLTFSWVLTWSKYCRYHPLRAPGSLGILIGALRDVHLIAPVSAILLLIHWHRHVVIVLLWRCSLLLLALLPALLKWSTTNQNVLVLGSPLFIPSWWQALRVYSGKGSLLQVLQILGLCFWVVRFVLKILLRIWLAYTVGLRISWLRNRTSVGELVLLRHILELWSLGWVISWRFPHLLLHWLSSWPVTLSKILGWPELIALFGNLKIVFKIFFEISQSSRIVFQFIDFSFISTWQAFLISAGIY